MKTINKLLCGKYKFLLFATGFIIMTIALSVIFKYFALPNDVATRDQYSGTKDNPQPTEPPSERMSVFKNAFRTDRLKYISELQYDESFEHAIDYLVSLHNTDVTLAKEESDELLNFLLDGKPANLDSEQWHLFVNVALNLLRKQHYVNGLCSFLAATATSHESKTLRLYGIQHIGCLIENSNYSHHFNEIVLCLENILNDPSKECSGSALLILSDIRNNLQNGIAETPILDNASNKQISFVADRLNTLINSHSVILLGSDIFDPNVKISAIHTCVDNNITSALPSIRHIATDGTLVSTLRKAAIHGIGQLGTVEDLALLDALPQGDTNLALAIIPAKKELEKRLGQKR